MRTPLHQILIAVYAVFAISSGARSAVQIATKFDEAPVAYLLSLFAAVVYLIAGIALRYRGPKATALAWTAIGIEAAGVIIIGTWTALDDDLFADETVWSNLGAGYGYVPLLLPILGLWWLNKKRTAHQSAQNQQA